MKVNVLQGLSKYFGDHGHLVYLLEFLPADILRGIFPVAIGGTFIYVKESAELGRSADIFHMSAFYILFFSFIGHKEPRFLLPILPFIFLMSGYFIEFLSKKKSGLLKLALRLFLLVNTVVEVFFILLRLNFHNRFWDVMEYLAEKGDTPPRSLYTAHRFETPYYSWLH